MARRIVVTATSFPSFDPRVFKVPFVFELSRRMAKMTRQTIVVSTPYITGARLREQRSGLSIHRYRYGFTGLCDGSILPNMRRRPWLILQTPFLLAAGMADLIRRIRRHEPSVVHAHWLVPQGLLAVIYRKLLRPRDLRIVVTSHGGDLYGLRGLGGLTGWVIRNADLLTVVNSSMLDEVRRIAPDLQTPVDVIPMGVDTELFAPERADSSISVRYGLGHGPLILFAGRLAEKKGVGFLLDAMPAILAALPNARLLIVGGGPQEPLLRGQVAELGIGHAVVFAGVADHSALPAYFATADVFVGPSITAGDGDREGLPVAFMEAMSAGCVVVVSHFDGIEDLVRDGVNGYVVPPGDAGAIAARVVEVLSDPARLAPLRQQARQDICRHFDWSIIARRYLSALDEGAASPVPQGSQPRAYPVEFSA